MVGGGWGVGVASGQLEFQQVHANQLRGNTALKIRVWIEGLRDGAD